jgi:hypothetical protein
MNVSVPVYVERLEQEDGRPRHRVRPLFFERPCRPTNNLGAPSAVSLLSSARNFRSWARTAP